MVGVAGTGLTLPMDVERYGQGDSEYEAGQTLLQRAIKNLGPRFANYVVVDAEFATAPFLHTVGDLGLRVVARLKENLPELCEADRCPRQRPESCRSSPEKRTRKHIPPSHECEIQSRACQ
jgi:hypothetical protein